MLFFGECACREHGVLKKFSLLIFCSLVFSVSGMQESDDYEETGDTAAQSTTAVSRDDDGGAMCGSGAPSTEGVSFAASARRRAYDALSLCCGVGETTVAIDDLAVRRMGVLGIELLSAINPDQTTWDNVSEKLAPSLSLTNPLIQKFAQNPATNSKLIRSYSVWCPLPDVPDLSEEIRWIPCNHDVVDIVRKRNWIAFALYTSVNDRQNTVVKKLTENSFLMKLIEVLDTHGRDIPRLFSDTDTTSFPFPTPKIALRSFDDVGGCLASILLINAEGKNAYTFNLTGYPAFWIDGEWLSEGSPESEGLPLKAEEDCNECKPYLSGCTKPCSDLADTWDQLMGNFKVYRGFGFLRLKHPSHTSVSIAPVVEERSLEGTKKIVIAGPGISLNTKIAPSVASLLEEAKKNACNQACYLSLQGTLAALREKREFLRPAAIVVDIESLFKAFKAITTKERSTHPTGWGISFVHEKPFR